MGIIKSIVTSKTYLAGLGLILCGAGALIGDAAKIDSVATAGAWAGSIPTHPGTQMVLAGLATFGIGHKVEKAKAAAAPPKK